VRGHDIESLYTPFGYVSGDYFDIVERGTFTVVAA
jgi:hypothetical protein